MKTVLGIDPGLKGGLAILSDDGVICEAMPVIGNQVDRPGLLRWLRAHREQIDFALLELSHMRPGQSTQSVFTFARGIGVIEMALAAVELGYACVAPSAWTRSMHAGLPSDLDPKEKSRLALMQRYPSLDLRVGRSAKPHEGMMDALLIADYGRRTVIGDALAQETMRARRP